MKKVLPFILAIVFVVAMAVPALAVTDPYFGIEFPAPYGVNTSYFCYADSTANWLLAMDVLPNEYYVRAEYVDTVDAGFNRYDIKIVFPESRNVTYYKLNSSETEYVYDSESFTNGYNTYKLPSVSIGYSSVDVKTVDGHVVFQGPLTLEGAVQNSLTAEAERLTQTLMIIALCGVGCLAFLILLPTLKKVFSHFRIN